MEKVIVIVSLLLVTAVQAGELKITENETGITAEYAGTPADKSRDSAMTPATNNTPDMTSVEYRTAQIERLKNEVEELSTVTGNETENELKSKSELVDDAKHKIEMFTMEIRQMTGNAQPVAASNVQPAAVGNTQSAAVGNTQSAAVGNVQPNTADGTSPKVETIAELRNKRQAMKNEVRAQKEALVKFIASANAQ